MPKGVEVQGVEGVPGVVVADRQDLLEPEEAVRSASGRDHTLEVTTVALLSFQMHTEQATIKVMENHAHTDALLNKDAELRRNARAVSMFGTSLRLFSVP